LLSHPLDILKRVSTLEQPYALVAVTHVSGGTLRTKGALMAVTETDVFGFISAGCIDGDIVFQARETLTQNKVRHLVYGEGSQFKDIALPCGGTIKVTIMPRPQAGLLEPLVKGLQNRTAAALNLSDTALHYQPKLRLRLIGRGAPFSALAELAHSAGFEIHGQSPNKELRKEYFTTFDYLTDPHNPPAVQDDAWTAIVLLFHDHDWEPALLAQALGGHSFYIGAMGSDQTQVQRLASLQNLGIKNTDRIRGPIGVIPAMRNAQHLAVSILAEIIDTAQKQGRLS